MALRIRIRNRHRKISKAGGFGSGPLGRITKLRKLVTALIRHERIEGFQAHVDESRGYAELLLAQAVRYGDKHKPTMEMADYWLLEKDLVHKLFKVLVPRYENYPGSFTRQWHLPTTYPGKPLSQVCLELKGNPWPPVVPKMRDSSNSLTNILVAEARKDYHCRKETEGDHTELLPVSQRDSPRTFLSVKVLEEQMKELRLHKRIDKDSVPPDGTPV